MIHKSRLSSLSSVNFGKCLVGVNTLTIHFKASIFRKMVYISLFSVPESFCK